MAAIYLPQPRLDELSLAPADTAPVAAAPRRVLKPRRPTLPDRATRVRRRRLAVLVLAALVVGSTWALVQMTVSGDGAAPVGSNAPAAEPGGPEVVEGQLYVVQPGDTLWSIATEVAPGRDPRPVVDRLRAAQGDAPLQVGDRLRIEVD